MLLFHADLGVAPGGFLGVSTFYTLSGFLITSLLLEERSRNGRVDLGQFWVRRARRLLPAALLGLLLVVASAPLFAEESQLAQLRGDVPWALGYLLNWRLIAENTSYALLFSQPSPVQHFWSLAIEGQFYVVLPVLLALAVRLRGAHAKVVIFAALALASAALSAWLSDAGATTDRVYYGSDTRACELLVGCALAAALEGRGAVSPVRGIGFAALVAMLVSWFAFSLDSAWLYRGGLGLFSLLSAALVVSALDATKSVGRLLAWSPLVSLGRISYGLYVYHWPVYLALTPERLGLGVEITFVIRAAVATGLAWVSERAFERPVRRGRLLAGRSGVLAAALGTALVVAVLIPTTRGVEGLSFAADDAVIPDAAGGALPRFGFFGDSTMLTLKAGLAPWLRKSGGAKVVRGATIPGCGLAESGHYTFDGKGRDVPPRCRSLRGEWRAVIAQGGIEVALVMVGPWDVRPRRLPGEDVYRKLGDPLLDDVVRREISGAIELFSDSGAFVVWLTAPRFAAVPTKVRELHEYNEQVDRFNQLLLEAAARQPGRVNVVDFAAYMGATDERHADPNIRPDGVHYSRPGAATITEDWLGPRVLAALQGVGPDLRR